jgi:hypothetical protein
METESKRFLEAVQVPLVAAEVRQDIKHPYNNSIADCLTYVLASSNGHRTYNKGGVLFVRQPYVAVNIELLGHSSWVKPIEVIDRGEFFDVAHQRFDIEGGPEIGRRIKNNGIIDDKTEALRRLYDGFKRLASLTS